MNAQARKPSHGGYPDTTSVIAEEIKRQWGGGHGRDPARIDEVIERLRVLWKQNPQMRLGQLVVNVADGHDPFGIEDDEFLAHINYVQTEGFGAR